MDIDKIILKLYEIGGIKFGQFKLKSGLISPFYMDLRILVSHPDLLKEVALHVYGTVRASGAKYDLVCGVPYAALPMATIISIEDKLPMLMVRKEIKDHGTKQQIEGKFSPGQNCLVIEDIVTSGESVMGVAKVLQQEGIKVNDLAVFMDREQGGETNITKKGYRFRSVIKITEVLNILKKHNKITLERYKEVMSHIKGNDLTRQAPKELSFSERAKLSQSTIGKKLFSLMEEKKTNLCVAADVTSKKELLALASSIGPEICILKVHIDILEDFDKDLIVQLKNIAKKYNFLIFEDRKFADIGNTVRNQYCGGIFKIIEWADVTNSHIVSGESSIAALQEDGLPRGRGLLLITQMSDVISKSIAIAKKHPKFVFGFISQERLIPDAPEFVYCTPGVSLHQASDERGQNYNSPAHVIIEKGSDVIIVGRGIISATDPRAAAHQYREQAWSAYQKRIGQGKNAKL